MTPTELIRWYYRKRDSFGAPALNFVDSVGRIYAETCVMEDCAANHRIANSMQAYVCGKCGAPWNYWDATIFKGDVQTSGARNMFEMKNGRWVDVGTIIHRFLTEEKTKWDMRLFVANALGYSLRELAESFRETFPDAGGSLGKSVIADRVTRVREQFDTALREAGIL